MAFIRSTSKRRLLATAASFGLLTLAMPAGAQTTTPAPAATDDQATDNTPA